MSADRVWLAIGLIGQGLFFARVLVQWIASERQGTSVVPRAFWHLSIFGGATLFAYALHQRDIVFGLGQAFGLLVYGRNLSFRRPAPIRLASAETPA